MQSLTEDDSVEDRMITIKQLMSLAQIGRTTIYAEIDRGHLRPIKIGTATRFWRSEILAWLCHA